MMCWRSLRHDTHRFTICFVMTGAEGENHTDRIHILYRMIPLVYRICYGESLRQKDSPLRMVSVDILVYVCAFLAYRGIKDSVSAAVIPDVNEGGEMLWLK